MTNSITISKLPTRLGNKNVFEKGIIPLECQSCVTKTLRQMNELRAASKITHLMIVFDDIVFIDWFIDRFMF